MKGGAICVFAAWCLVVVLVAQVHETEAADCIPDLKLCVEAILGGPPPSPECCVKLKEQAPCYCNYLQHPRLKPYLISPIFKQVFATCGLTIPTC